MIHLSQAAISEILRLRAKRNDPELFFRLGTQQSACLPLSYVMAFETVVQPDDELFSCNGIQVVIDTQSLPAVRGLTLDYSEDLMGGGFRVHNPNAVRTCGCGNAFSLSESTL